MDIDICLRHSTINVNNCEMEAVSVKTESLWQEVGVVLFSRVAIAVCKLINKLHDSCELSYFFADTKHWIDGGGYCQTIANVSFYAIVMDRVCLITPLLLDDQRS